jgi:hypothetical protein
MTNHLYFTIRSRAAAPTPTNAATRRRLVTAVPAIGWKGQLIQRAAVSVCFLPDGVLARMPFFSRHAEKLPLPPGVVDAGLARARVALGRDDLRAIWLLPPRSNRRTMVAGLLFTDGQPVGHLRLETGEAARHRQSILPSAPQGPRTSISWPQLLDSWHDASGFGQLTTGLPITRYTSTNLNADELLDLRADLAETLQPECSPPAGNWEPVHGDLTPWNLRTRPDGNRVLFDWEDAGWGPPFADLVRHLSTSRGGESQFRSLTSTIRAACTESIDLAIARAETDRTRHGADQWKRSDDTELIARLLSMRDIAVGTAAPTHPGRLRQRFPRANPAISSSRSSRSRNRQTPAP